MLETDVYNNNIYKYINLLIKNNCLTKPKAPKLRNWIVNLDNPNDLDIVNEIKQIDIWLGEDPTRSKRWKKGWMERVQSWLIRTKRFDEHKPLKIASSSFASIPEPLNNQKPFIHECLIHCSHPCWMRELTIASANNPNLDFENWDYKKAYAERMKGEEDNGL